MYTLEVFAKETKKDIKKKKFCVHILRVSFKNIRWQILGLTTESQSNEQQKLSSDALFIFYYKAC